MEEFRKKILKLDKKRKTIINNSIGVKDAYRYLRKHKWEGIGQPLTESEFYLIIRSMNNRLAEELLKGKDIILPCYMGRIEVRKNKAVIKIKDGKMVTNLGIDWNSTLKLWEEDEESLTNKTLVRYDNKEIFKVFYIKRAALYKNKTYYTFIVNRKLRRAISFLGNNGKLDAFNLY